MRIGFYFIAVLFLVSCCFKKKHHEGRITRANAVWMPDSCYAKLCMQEFGGSTDTLKPQESPKGYVLTTTTADCNEYLTEAQKIVYAAAANTPALGFEHESSENGEGLNITVGKVGIRYNFKLQQSQPATVEERTFESDYTMLDSVVVLNKTFRNVKLFAIKNTSILGDREAINIWLVPHFGIVQYEEKGGLLHLQVR